MARWRRGEEGGGPNDLGRDDTRVSGHAGAGYSSKSPLLKRNLEQTPSCHDLAPLNGAVGGDERCNRLQVCLARFGKMPIYVVQMAKGHHEHTPDRS